MRHNKTTETIHIYDDGRHMTRYCRLNHLSRDILEEKMLSLYGLTSTLKKDFTCYLFPSGVSAITSIFFCFCKRDRLVVIGDELYADSDKTPKWLFQQGLSGEVVALSEYKQRYDELKDAPVSIAFFETCSNPTGKEPDYHLLQTLKERFDTIICLDNTWLTCANYNPFRQNVKPDIVVESMSKYLSIGQAIGGSCIVKSDLADAVWKHIKLHGLHVSPQTCDIVLDSLSSLDNRLSQTSKVMEQVLLSICEKTGETIPVKPEHFRYRPGVFVFYAPVEGNVLSPTYDNKDSQKTKKVTMHFLRDRLSQLAFEHGFVFETSFGSVYPKVDCFPKLKGKLKGNVLRVRMYVGHSLSDVNRIVQFVLHLKGRLNNE